MFNTTEAVSHAHDVRDRIIVALDVDTADEARTIAQDLAGSVGGFKIGLQLFTAAGPDLVREFTRGGTRVFLDLKFHDIPNTVAKAAVEAARLGVWMFNIHASGGGEMMRRTVDDVTFACEREGIERPLIIGVTVLTSSDTETLDETGVSNNVEDQVVILSRLAHRCGLDGVVASPREVRAVKAAIGDPRFLTVTPGIRQDAATDDDQKRVTTVTQAISNGSDYLVIGRPVTQAADRLAAVRQLIGQV